MQNGFIMRSRILLALLSTLLAGAALRAGPVQAATEVTLAPVSSQAFAYVVISVADMDQALGLWVDQFGMQLVTRSGGPDAGMAKVWGLPADGIVDQALLRTPGAKQGGVHLVRFKTPGPAVRENAAPTDLVLKSVDIAVVDIHKRYEELSAAGYKFRSPVGSMQAGDITFLEAHTSAHDGVNVVLVEVLGKHEITSAKGYGVVPQVVLTTSDNVREAGFFQSLMGLSQVSHNRFTGPEVEKTIGLPSGAALDIHILGDLKNDFGKLEIVQYEGVKSSNLYPRSKPPARGMLSVTYIVDNLSAMLSLGAKLGIVDHGQTTCILGQGRMASVTSPAGLRVDLFEVTR